MFAKAVAVCFVVAGSSAALSAGLPVVPTPQYVQPLDRAVAVANGGSVDIVLGPPAAASAPKMKLAAESIRQALQPAVRVNVTTIKPAGPAICLWDWSAGPHPPVPLNALDRTALSDPGHWGQGYMLRTTDASTVWAVGGTAQGVLFAAMTLLQAIRRTSSGVEIPGIYVRDYPDFEFRTASDWILNGEVNRWSMDRAQGIEPYRALIKRRLDRALRYKINTVLIDGFGWGLKQRFPGYAELMLDLNRYARARGIHLLYGGYGASYGIAYQTGPIYEEGAYLGEVFKNRESYPDGPVYQCMGFDRGKKGVNPSTLGSCRANEELNRLKGEELRRFVDAIEPGALYIHNEDFGNYRRTEQLWQKRCDRCRKRWPNNLLVAPDGGAGGLANGYAALVRAVNSVKHPDSGYDAARDCQITLISPVYHPDSSDPDDWATALELWANIGKMLPQTGNVQAGFREVFPEKYGSEKWTDRFNTVMRTAGTALGQFMYFAGGSDDWVTDYPLTGVPSMNALFRGATTIYNGTGDAYREPMEIVNAEYSWNTRSRGFFSDPERNGEAVSTWRRYIFQPDQPKEIFGAGKLYDQACTMLYGPQAGPFMAAWYREAADLPDVELPVSDVGLAAGYLPMTWNRLYAIPEHWRHLAPDSKTWGPEIANEAYAAAVARLKLDRGELHRRLARRWRIAAELNRKGAARIREALAASPLAESVEDLRFFAVAHRVYQPLLESLADYHAGLQAWFATPSNVAEARVRFDAALRNARSAHSEASEAFPHPVDPVGGDAGAIRRYSGLLVEAIETMQKRL